MTTDCKVTEIFCIIDEFCKHFDAENAGNLLEDNSGVKRRQRATSLSDSEIMTILLYFHFGTFCNFKHYYLFFIKGTMKSYFPKAVLYNRFVELESRVFFQLMFFLNLGAFGRCTGITFVDSTMIPVCHNLRRYANKVFKGIANDGKGTMGWCHGFKLHLACNDRGEIIAFVLTGANVSDKDPNVFKVLAKRLYGKLFADKGYISQKLFDFLFEDGIQLVTGLRVNLIEKKHMQLLVEAIEIQHLLESCTIFILMSFLWSFQEWLHIGRKAIVPDALQISHRFVFIGNNKPTTFQQSHELFAAN